MRGPATQAATEFGELDLAGYDERFLLCRLRGDDWPDPSTWHWRRLIGPGGRVLAYQHTMMCRRCNKIKTEVMYPDGSLQPKAPHYPEGYLIKGARLYRPRVRLELMRRLDETSSPGTVEDVALSPEEVAALGLG